MAIYTGKTVEEAIERGLKSLKAKRENVHIQVEQKEKKGFLGFGKKRARVNIEAIHEETVRKADRLADRGANNTDTTVPKAQSAMEATLELSQVVKAVRAAAAEKEGEITAEEREVLIEAAKREVAQNKTEETEPMNKPIIDARVEAVSNPVDVDSEETEEKIGSPVLVKEEVKINLNGLTETEQDFADKISLYLSQVTKEMGIETKVNLSKEGSLIIFNLTSNHDALLIGKHGKILQGLQVLAKAYANSVLDTRTNIAVNVGDYHEKRKAYIVSLAHRASERARTGETVYINDLQSNERKIIHTIIAQETNVKSHSEGQESNRYIVVSKQI